MVDYDENLKATLLGCDAVLEIKNNNIKLSFKPYEIHTILLK